MSFEKKESLSITTQTLNASELIDLIYKGNNLPQDNRFLPTEEGGVFGYFNLMHAGRDNKFPVVKEGDKIVGLSELEKSPYSDKTFWIQFLSIDPKYQNKGYASKLGEEIFRFAKQEGYSLETSSYTEIGYEKLKGLFNKLAEEYSVNFIDKKKI
ncbi:MAG: GNAT family N-acetyltransferase [Candidatus Paceibacterota bacterium]|jgi:GNAT superfamily N-acetyltransferase